MVLTDRKVTEEEFLHDKTSLAPTEPPPALIPSPDDDEPFFDTMQDVWTEPKMRIIEEVSMDTPLTCDSTSRLEQLPNYSQVSLTPPSFEETTIFIPMVMHWVSNNSYPWTIPNKKLSDVLEDIFIVVCKQPGDFRNDNGCNLAFSIVCQRISEWRASIDEYRTKEACKEYAEYQLEDSCFVYEDPDNKDSPGAFLSEFILCIFAVQLNATKGCQKIDLLNCSHC
ncbi:hypothetical protein BDR04DRAFT_1165150 [Suillus decipiens]|nr:hypothetical protein BDR04DRAFT_1165150 [Suillus decipiens]